ncbi:MAG: hypothetical protein UR78_C0003G0024 [Candidatus Moranbacteria bacterium GW2011_GWF2_35_39]|nr:MAG: hypothetical protein UR78_C0003G0024 [Candidatus Moranbacteria bacterium GW2011_GWF2_35_39]
MDDKTRERIIEAIKSYKELPVPWNEIQGFFKKVGYYPNGAPDMGRSLIGVGDLPILWPEKEVTKEDVLLTIKYLPVVVFDFCRLEQKRVFDKEILEALLEKEEFYMMEDLQYYPGGVEKFFDDFSLRKELEDLIRKIKQRCVPVGSEIVYVGDEVLFTQKLKEVFKKRSKAESESA